MTNGAIDEPCTSKVVESYKDALDFTYEIGFPVVVRPAYSNGGRALHTAKRIWRKSPPTGSGFQGCIRF